MTTQSDLAALAERWRHEADICVNQWAESNSTEAGYDDGRSSALRECADELTALAARLPDGPLVALRDELQRDRSRPEGRWGMHGHSAVDDDYFMALDYVIDRIDEILDTGDDEPTGERT